jgi:predicted Zn-dependent protease with MMP-like domain
VTASVVHPWGIRGGSVGDPGAGGWCQYDRAVEPVGVVEFERLVAEALDGLPDELVDLMDNVVVLTADRGDPPDLLGLYDGVPLTQREDYGGLVMPDRILVYRLALCEVCGDADELRHEVAVTVVHEVAHHFGIDDDRLDELGWA